MHIILIYVYKTTYNPETNEKSIILDITSTVIDTHTSNQRIINHHNIDIVSQPE